MCVSSLYLDALIDRDSRRRHIPLCSFNWTFSTTLAKVQDLGPNWRAIGGEGASENSLVRLSDGTTIMAVVRFGAGDGGRWNEPACSYPCSECSNATECAVCFLNYRTYTSTDEGRTWSGKLCRC